MNTTNNKHSVWNSRHSLSIACCALALVCAPAALATPDKGANCASCHSTSDFGMYLSNPEGTTNLGSGALKFFKVTQGSTLSIDLNVTNDWGGNYGLTMNNLGTAPGYYTNTNHLSYTADPTWTSRTTYYTVGPTGLSPNNWTFNLLVKTNTPADFYAIQTQMAGRDVDFTKWSQVESFYIQVVSPSSLTPPAPTLSGPQMSGTSFSVLVPTSSGFTYYLEYKTNLSSAAWNLSAQSAGDGTLRTLTDIAATNSTRFYHVRVQ
jgi:hypothetical protein